MSPGEIWRRIAFLFRRKRFDSELDEEMRFHLEMGGDGSRRRFGNPTLLKEVARDMWGWNSIEVLVQDIRYALRAMRRNPAFTVVVVMTLALGIGANTAIFSIVNGVLLRPLPFPDQERLVMVYSRFAPGNLVRGAFSVADFVDLSAQNQSFEQFAAFVKDRATLTGIEKPEVVSVVGVTPGFFSVVGVRPLLGRTLTPEDGKGNSARVVILSESYWRRAFAGDPKVLGRGIVLDGDPTTVVGVMPGGFQFPQRGIDLWYAMRFTPPKFRFPFFLTGIAQLKPGTSLSQAQADLNTIAPRIERTDPKTYSRLSFPVMPLGEALVGNVRLPLLVLLGAVGLVLLIACVNVANLLLARAASREREMAIRLGIGASRMRLVRQLLTESILLALTGGIAGVALAEWGVRWLRTLDVANIPRIEAVQVDGVVLAFSLILSLVCGIGFGLAPAIESMRFQVSESLKQHERGGTESRSRRRIRSTLVVSEIALSFVLLTGAGLLLRSFAKLEGVDPGFRTHDLLVARVSPSGARYNDGKNLNTLFRDILLGLQSLPGAHSVALTGSLPPDRPGWGEGYRLQGHEDKNGGANPAVTLGVVSPGYFRTLGIPLRRGRVFDEHDTDTSAPVVVISETLARRHFPNEDPIGKRLMFGWSLPNQPWREIVGVVGDVKYRGLAEATSADYYAPLTQNPFTAVYAVVRAPNAGRLAGPVRAIISELDKDLPVSDVSTMDEAISKSVSQPRFRTSLLTVFASVALLLAAIGIYGLVAYSITQRMQEFGIRIALGAQPGDVLGLVVRWSALLVLTGLVAGAIGSFLLTHLLDSLLFRLSSTDPFTFTLAAVVLIVVGMLASVIPAYRATRIDPMRALRQE